MVTPDGFDARHIQMLTDAFAVTEARAQTFARGATDLAALLARSLALLAQMGDALAAPERAAAEAARVEAEALAAASRTRDAEHARRQIEVAATREVALAIARAGGRES